VLVPREHKAEKNPESGEVGDVLAVKLKDEGEQEVTSQGEAKKDALGMINSVCKDSKC
jgi:hypothetical protein